jgi:phospholipase/lecithinase/hemolysin
MEKRHHSMNTPSFLPRFVRFLAPTFILPALLAFVGTPPTRAANAASPLETPFSAVHVLGDSLSDTGRTVAVLSQVMPNVFPLPGYAPGRFSNGALWVEYFSAAVNLPYQPLNNFAWAGSASGRDNAFGPPLPGMLDQLDELLASSPRKLDHRALYVVFGGANDFFQMFAPGANPDVIIGQAVTNLITSVRTLHAAGAREIVVVDLPNIGLTPRANVPPSNPQIATFLSGLFNQALGRALDQLEFSVVRVSAFALLNRFVAQPEAYGFTNVTTPGILNPTSGDTHLFWDDIHPTTRAHRFVSQAVFAAVAEAGLLKQYLKH